jgi:hypothetical protein
MDYSCFYSNTSQSRTDRLGNMFQHVHWQLAPSSFGHKLPASLPGKRAGSKTLDALPVLHNAAILVFLPAHKDLT